MMIAPLLFVASATPIPVPTPAQLRYQSTDFVALIHFNMGTFAHNGDPCCDASNWDFKAPYATGKTSDPATFNPKKLNTTQWFDSITALGANLAILTAKHGCGFLLWPTNSTLPDGSPYGYNVGGPGAAIETDVIGEFVASAKAAGVGYGFYYSIMKSFYLCHSFSGTNSCTERVLPGQHNFSATEYSAIVKAQVTELWTRYGDMSEVWVDSALGGMGDLMTKLQPQAAGTPKNPTAWCGTESGHPSRDVGPSDVWSIGNGFHGDPNGSNWLPKFCDPQLFREHVWFWEPNLQVRTLAEMIPIYHDIVGRGMVMELAFSIDRDGLVQDTHAATYKALGDWVRECYGTPVASTSGQGRVLTMPFAAGAQVAFDRVLLQEDLAWGQRVRNFSVDALLPAADGSGTAGWKTIARGGAIGMKRIIMLPQEVTTATAARLTVEAAVAKPMIKLAGVYAKCRTA